GGLGLGQSRIALAEPCLDRRQLVLEAADFRVVAAIAHGLGQRPLLGELRLGTLEALGRRGDRVARLLAKPRLGRADALGLLGATGFPPAIAPARDRPSPDRA